MHFASPPDEKCGLVAAAILAGVRRRQKVATQVGWFAGGVMGQAVIMLLAIFLLNRVH